LTKKFRHTKFLNKLASLHRKDSLPQRLFTVSKWSKCRLIQRQYIKVKGPDIYILPLTGKPKQQQFTIQSDILTSTCSRRGGAVGGSPLPNLTDFGPAVAAWQTYLC